VPELPLRRGHVVMEGASGKARSENAARKKEMGVDHVGDTARDKASSTTPQGLVGYVEDTRIRAGDKCREVTVR
jgi:hypothetical protein